MSTFRSKTPQCWGWDFAADADAKDEYRRAVNRFAERYGVEPRVCYVRSGTELPPDAHAIFGEAWPGPYQFRFPVES